MKKKLSIVGGSKGGVGKSIVSTAVIDLLRQRGEKVLIIDSDTSNPDVYKSHHKTLECLTLDLADALDGVAQRGIKHGCNGGDQPRPHATTRRSTTRSLLMSALSELDRALTTWVINRQRYSLST